MATMTKTEKKALEYGRNYIHKCDPFNKSLHVSLIMRGNFLIEWGVNKENQNHQAAVDWKHSKIHSEFEVIRKFKSKFSIKRLAECDLWNMRFDRKGNLKLSCPCKTCSTYLEKYKPRRVYYSIENGEFRCH